jgi:tetratricopeptide (TPR) repeat protein
LFHELGDQVGAAKTHLNLAGLLGLQGRYPEAVRQARRARQLFRVADDRTGQARALNNIGWYLTRAGDHRSALAYSGKALALQQELGDRSGSRLTPSRLSTSPRPPPGSYATSSAV